MLTPGNSIGIVGGGQLGRMLAMAATRLGFKTVILDPQPDAPAFQCANHSIIADFDDLKALNSLSLQCDVITYEFENVPVDALRQIAGNTPVYPPLNALETSQDRLVEKEFFKSLKIGTAHFFKVEDKPSLLAALKQMQGSGILKTRRFGYDGKGQVRITNEQSIDAAIDLASSNPCIIESLIDFEREISIIAARSADGATAMYDPAENIHHDGILRTSTVPARISVTTLQNAREYAERILDELKYVGVIGIEFFLLADGSLLVNEFAPRVHNSGHWSEAACVISQFEQHIRAISGMPLANPERHSNCLMENIIGHDIKRLPEILATPGTMLHLYGKAETRMGRKMGHFTRISRKS